MTGPAHDAVDHPAHYTAHPSGVECIELTRMLPFVIGNAVKYIWRWELKNGIEDLRKARWYIADALVHPGHQIDWAARRLANHVAEQDDNPDRALLLHLLITDQLERALKTLDRVIYMGGDSDA